MAYIDGRVTFSPGQLRKLKTAFNKSRGVNIRFSYSQLIAGQHPAKFTQTQAKRLSKAMQKGIGAEIKFSPPQLKDMVKNGGIFPLLAAIPALLAAAAPVIAKTAALGALGGAASYGASKAIQAATKGKGLYLKPHRGSGNKKKS